MTGTGFTVVCARRACVRVCARMHIQVLLKIEPRALCIRASTLPLNFISGMKLSVKVTLLPHGL